MCRLEWSAKGPRGPSPVISRPTSRIAACSTNGESGAFPCSANKGEPRNSANREITMNRTLVRPIDDPRDRRSEIPA